MALIFFCYELRMLLIILVYDKLYHKWKYLLVWWNCQDFAVRVAALLVQDPRCWETLAEIAVALKVQLSKHIISNRDKKLDKITKLGAVGAFLPFVQPLGCCLLFSAAIASFGYSWLDSKRLRGWLEGMVELNDRVLELAPFHRMAIIVLFRILGAELPALP